MEIVDFGKNLDLLKPKDSSINHLLGKTLIFEEPEKAAHQDNVELDPTKKSACLILFKIYNGSFASIIFTKLGSNIFDNLFAKMRSSEKISTESNTTPSKHNLSIPLL